VVIPVFEMVGVDAVLVSKSQRPPEDRSEFSVVK
jgi:hypothetical protein